MRIGDELGPHYSIEHLAEKNEAFVNVDAHLEDYPIDVLLLGSLVNSHVFLHLCWELPYEGGHMLLHHLCALIVLRKVFPSLLERLKVIFEALQRIIIL